MKPTLLIAVIALALSPLATSGQPEEKKGSSPPAGRDDSEQEVRRLEQQLREAALKPDASFFDRYWDEDYLRTNSAGAILAREEALSDYRSGALKYEQLDYDNIRVRVFGDTAVVTARAKVKGSYQKTPHEGVYRHTRVWVKRPEGWKIVAYHASRIEEDED